ncbi:hypothetical protein Ancab_001362, partial [Ancistrocladus abbreviatus]
YKSGRLFTDYRPAASPTFDPSLHTKSHKVLEIMNRNTTENSERERTPTRSQPELIPRSNHRSSYILSGIGVLFLPNKERFSWSYVVRVIVFSIFLGSFVLYCTEEASER